VAAARRLLYPNLTRLQLIKIQPEIISGGEDGLFRVTLPGGDVVECTMSNNWGKTEAEFAY
jgi:hypothetical protein